MAKLDGQIMVVTGAAGILGRAVAKTARGYGAKVVGLDIVQDPALHEVDEYHRVDLTDTGAVAGCFAALPDLTALVNVAGGFGMGSALADDADAQWDWLFKINVTTMRNATRAAVPILKSRSRGAIINIGALGALSGQGSMSAYCCAKSSVMRFTESLSEELRHEGINVNAVLPSIIDTPQNRADMPDADFSSWVTPEDLAETICFLASEEAHSIHGALLPVRGLS